MRILKEKTKLPLLVDEIIICIQNPNELADKFLEMRI